MAFSGTQYTRQGLSATSRSLYGSFAGKAAATPSVSIVAQVIQLQMQQPNIIYAGKTNA